MKTRQSKAERFSLVELLLETSSQKDATFIKQV
jgi:hypothetical protein